MAANIDPVYSKAGDVQASAGTASFASPFLIAAVNASLNDGVGTIDTDIYQVFKADATNGGFIRSVRVKFVTTTGTTTSVACKMMFFVSTKSAHGQATTNADTWLIGELALPATGALSTTVAQPDYEYPLGFALPLAYTILVKITVAQSANTGFIAVGIGGKY